MNNLEAYTQAYNGMFINGKAGESECYVTDDYNTFSGVVFKSVRSAKIRITKARGEGVSASRGT